eukprot:scaffold13247_cov163-Amphora_coffeaeformis.AAC.1
MVNPQTTFTIGDVTFDSTSIPTVDIRSSDHRIIGSSDHRIIGSSDHRIIGSSDHRIIGSSDHRIIGSCHNPFIIYLCSHG